jgi:hypothetical protein
VQLSSYIKLEVSALSLLFSDGVFAVFMAAFFYLLIVKAVYQVARY